MRLTTFLLAVFAVAASAQSPTDAGYDREMVVTRLTADLANLKDFPANRDTIALWAQCPISNRGRAARPAECGPLDRVREDLALGRPPRTMHLPTEALAYNLVRTLAGRELEPEGLSLLSNALVDSIAVADRAVEVRTRVSGSRAFRDSVMRTYAALYALGVDRNRAESFLRNFVQEAEKFSKPPDFIPIPPAQPYR
jgi:hypothetical protein